MTKEEFGTQLQQELKEETPITPETNFKDLDSYGSLSSVVVMQLIEETFGVKMNPRAFRNIKTVNDIAAEIGENKFA